MKEKDPRQFGKLASSLVQEMMCRNREYEARVPDVINFKYYHKTTPPGGSIFSSLGVILFAVTTTSSETLSMGNFEHLDT